MIHLSQPGLRTNGMFSWFKHIFNHNSSDKETDYSRLIDFSELRKTIEYNIRDQDLFVQALKHRSYLPISQERRLHSNERLELLGDAVLALVAVDFLFERFPNKEEGELTNLKSLVVSRRVLARIGRSMKLGRFFLLSESEERSGGRNRASINSDAVEAIIGAIYLDGGLSEARRFIERKILCRLDEIVSDKHHANYKSMLLEYAQSRSYGVPSYLVKSVDGPDHEKIFTIQVKIQDDIVGLGTAGSKKRAEQLAAQEALRKLYLI